MGFNTFPCNPYPISTEELNKGNNDDLNTRVTALEGEVSDLNSTKANQITIAPFFNAEASYSVGDLVYYNGLTYRCTNDHEGDWDADDFAATTISNELDTLKSGLTKSLYVTATVRCMSADSDTIGYRSTGADEVAIQSLPNYPTGRTILGYSIESCYNGSMTKICLASILNGAIHVNSPVASESVTVVIRVYYI